MEMILEDFRIYLLEIGQVTSVKTTESYLSNIKQLLEYLEQNNKSIKDIDRVTIINYLEYIKLKDYKANTTNTKVNSLTSFNNYLKDKNIISKNIVFSKDKIQITNRQIEIYSDEEMKDSSVASSFARVPGTFAD